MKTPAAIDIERGYYTCTRCGEKMVTAVITDAAGRARLHTEPLYCPRCATTAQREKAWKRFLELKEQYGA